MSTLEGLLPIALELIDYIKKMAKNEGYDLTEFKGKVANALKNSELKKVVDNLEELRDDLGMD